MKCFLQPLHRHVLCFNCIIRLLLASFFRCNTLRPSLCPFKVFPVCSSRSNSPQTHTTTPFFLPEAHNGPQCSHCSVPIFRGGLLPTSSSIKWRRAERSAVVKHWLTLHCCPARRTTPNLSEVDDWLPSKLSQERWWLCFNESGSQGKNHSVSKPSGQLRTAKRPFNPTFHTLFIQLFKYLH